MQYPNRSLAYRETSINTSSPIRLVVMLYEGAIRFLKQAKEDTLRKDVTAKCHSVDRAMAIIHHLQDTLDYDKGGVVSFDLDRLYTYIATRIFEGSAKLDIAAFDEAIKLLTMLLSSWEELAKQEQGPAPTEFVAEQANEGRLRLNV